MLRNVRGVGVFSVVIGLTLTISSFASGGTVTTVKISGGSPFAVVGDENDFGDVTACNASPQGGRLYRNNETEPHLAVNPTDSQNMIAAWHQDRWSNGSAQGIGIAFTEDGGATWTSANVPFTRCSGAEEGDTGDFARASDPWLTFSPDGTAHLMALVNNTSITFKPSERADGRNGMLVSSSLDGGVSWSDPVVMGLDEGKAYAGHFHDKNSITADPFDSSLLYGTWNLFLQRQTLQMVSRSKNGGQKWGPLIPVNAVENIEKSEKSYFWQGAQIVVLPDNSLVHVSYRSVVDNSTNSYLGVEEVAFRSFDQGRHWERKDINVSGRFYPVGAWDFERWVGVRDGSPIPDVAANRSTGEVYLVWQGARSLNQWPWSLPSVLISKSSDGGATWSAPLEVSSATVSQANNDLAAQAFLPSVAVADDGTVGVLFYDFRNDSDGDAPLSADVHLMLFDSDLNSIEEIRVTQTSFDMRQMLIARGYFPGDYVGLEADGNDFVAAFTVGNNTGGFAYDTSVSLDTVDRQDIVFARIEK